MFADVFVSLSPFGFGAVFGASAAVGVAVGRGIGCIAKFEGRVTGPRLDGKLSIYHSQNTPAAIDSSDKPPSNNHSARFCSGGGCFAVNTVCAAP